ncbi:DVUA0089 family protein [Sphingomonas paeninsulae]|nr:DVUA0089 family protein [Sphingomonas paeninsulae]
MRGYFMKFRYALLLLAATAATPALAADFSFTGAFTNPNDVQTFTFAVGSPSTVTLRTWSYAGGTNAAGAAIPEGGFDPILALFDSTGAKIGENDDGGSNVAADSVTGAHYDTFFSSALGVGDYTVSIQAYSNFAVGPNLSDGFQDSGNFNGRNTDWAFDLLNVGEATQTGGGTGAVGAAPEPATWAMMIGGFGVAGGTLRRRRATPALAKV